MSNHKSKANQSFNNTSPRQRSDAQSQGASRQLKPQKEEIYEDVNQILKKAIDEIWEMFDDDGNGLFDIDETSSFIKHTLTEMGESPDYAEQDFLQCFQQF